MKMSRVRELQVFLTQLQQMGAYLATNQAAADAAGSACDCEIGTGGVWTMVGLCRDAERRPDYCRTLTHLAVRIGFDQLKLPTTNLSDPQLATAVSAIADLAGRAPERTERQFVIELQQHLRASLRPVIDRTNGTASEENP